MFPLPYIAPSSAAPAADISYIADLYASVSGTTYTFSGASLGAADSNRKIIVTVVGENGTTTVSSLTVAGQSCSLVSGTRIQNSSSTAEIWVTDATVPSGTTGDIVVTWAASQTRYYLGTYRCLYLGSASDTLTSIASTPTGTINIPAEGTLVCHVHSSAGTNTWTWTGPTETFDSNPITTITHSGAADDYAIAQTSYTVTATPSGTTNAPVMTCASFNKA